MSISEIVLRLGVLLLVALGVWLVVRLGRGYVEQQRRSVIAVSSASLASPSPTNKADVAVDEAAIRILAFSSKDCRQCHQFQTPALQKVQEALGDTVSIVEIDATSETELAERYHVLTVPTTVMLDRDGRVLAINYGFANTRKLLDQVDDIVVTH